MEITKTKEQLEFEEEQTKNEEVSIGIEPEKYNVIWHTKDYSIFELHRQYKKGIIDIRPSFQRFFVWDKKKASLLIESVLLNLPIPVIYLSEQENGKLLVIDGQQRLTSFFAFIDGEFPEWFPGNRDFKLTDLQVLKSLKNKYFRGLSEETQRKLENATIHTVVIKKESDPEIKFEIFERLNTGSVKLNDDELRNCVYRGKYMKLIKELAENNDFQFLLGLDKPDKRMRDRGLVLEFLAFYHNTYLNYKSPMKQFLNRELELNRDLNQALEKDYRQVFKQAVDITKTVFGDRAFRRFVAGDEEDPNGQWELKKINKALFDIIMFGFTKYPKSQIIPKADIIREELIFLMSKDIKFIESITLSTGNLERVNARFKKWLESLEEIVGLPSREQRNFTLEFKKQLFEQNPTCSICGQKIHTLDDSEIDHIEQYWRGGKTIPSNARLVHRYCNRRRGGRD